MTQKNPTVSRVLLVEMAGVAPASGKIRTHLDIQAFPAKSREINPSKEGT